MSAPLEPSKGPPSGPMGRVIGIVIAAALLAGGGVWSYRATHRPQAPGDAMAGMPGMADMDMGSMDGSIHLTAEQIKTFGVTFGTVDLRTLTGDVETVGTVTVDSSRLVQVAPKFAGFVERLLVNQAGRAVRKGEPLLEIYAPDLVAAQQELLVAGSVQQTIGKTSVPGIAVHDVDLVRAARRRLSLWDITDAQIDSVLASGKPKRLLTLYAPASGIVMEKSVVEGQSIMAGQTLYTIVDLSDVWVDAALRETDAASARVGDAALVEATGRPGLPIPGRITYIYPTLDVQARTARARITVHNAGGALVPGMYATVHIRTPSRAALTVARSAVLSTGERNVVFVDLGGGRLKPVEVELGRAAGDYVEVLGGLEPGQRIATSAQYLLDSESHLAEVMRSMMSQMGSGDMGTMPMPPSPAK